MSVRDDKRALKTLVFLCCLLLVLFLFLLQNRWRKWFVWVGVATTVFNWVTLIVVHALLVGEEVNGLDGPRCQFSFEMNSFKLKWVGQFVNQAFQVRDSCTVLVHSTVPRAPILQVCPQGFARNEVNFDSENAININQCVPISACELSFGAIHLRVVSLQDWCRIGEEIKNN